MGDIYLELTLIICIAAGLSIIFRYLKQPAILANIFAGILLGPLGLLHIKHGEVLQSLSEIGITLLLFMVGLELRLQDIKSVGKVALVAGIGQIVFTSAVGFLLCLLLNFSALASFYIAIALTFSSTIIIVKLLSDKKDLNSLYGKISVGILLVQDFVAILVLIFLSGFNTDTGNVSIWQFALIIMKAIVLFGWVILLSKTIIPKIIHTISKSAELLFLFSLAWAFGISAIVSSSFIGFSIEIGGFLAGFALANSMQNIQIVSKVRPLRDFFITIFFVMLGMEMIFENLTRIVFPSVLLGVFVLLGNPLIVMALLGMMGYRSRTGFLSGLTVAQISEFSLILMFMGNKLGHVSDRAVSIVTLVGAITFIFSTYMIMNGNKLYQVLQPLLRFFERKKTKEHPLESHEYKDHVVLIGANRMGESILEALLNKNDQLVVTDFDPDVVARLQDRKIPIVYGDIADSEIQEKIGLKNAKLVISTVPDVEDNLAMLRSLQQAKKKILKVVFALETEDARALYEAGADYVVLPHLAGGHHVAKILVSDNHMDMIERFKAKDMKYLR